MGDLGILSRKTDPCNVHHHILPPPSDSASPLGIPRPPTLPIRLPNSRPRLLQPSRSDPLGPGLSPQSRPPFQSSEPPTSGPTSFSQLPPSASVSFPLEPLPSVSTSFLRPTSFLSASSLSPDLLSPQPPFSASPQRLKPLPASRSRIRPGQAPPPLRGQCSPS